jgi:hypothetical protein
VEIDAMKLSIEKIGLEGGDILIPPINAQEIEATTEKRRQAHEQCQLITEMYEALAQSVKDVGVYECLRKSHDVSVGDLLVQANFGKKTKTF